MYTLPDLTYDYSELAPWISPEIMELHHSKHHQAYVTGLNTAIDQLGEARSSGNYSLLPKLEKDLAFHMGGHLNHSVFWKNMAPHAGGEPGGELRRTLDDTFAGFDSFQAHFAQAALSLQGSGWAILAWDCLGKRANIYQLYDQQANLPIGQIPLLMLDMWEHAFYLQYKNVKADYVTAWWNVVNWEDVTARYVAASHLDASLVS
jgi:Fe-Mn family superoxide dismutase